jgi:hypothetical protein
MTAPDRPLDTQTATPPPILPRRPIVGLAMDDDDLARLRERVEQKQRDLVALRDTTSRMLAAITHADA